MEESLHCYVIERGEDENDSLRDDWLPKSNFKEWLPVTSVATDFVTRHCLGTDDIDRQLQFASHIQSFFESDIARFADLLIDKGLSLPHCTGHFTWVYKGGNAMRFLMERLKRIIFAEIREAIESLYGEYFKASDMDFSIVIDREVALQLTPEDVHTFSKILFESMKLLRDDIWKDRDELPLFKLTERDLVTLLRETLDQMLKKVPENIVVDELAFLGKGVKVDPNVPARNVEGVERYSFELDFYNKGENMFEDVEVCEDQSSAHHMYASRNGAILFQPNDNPHSRWIHFDLVRMKMAFQLFEDSKLIKRVGGEVIDISITHPDDQMEIVNEQFRTLSGKGIKKYANYDLPGTQNSPKVQSYTPAMNIIDISKTLFIIETSKPWSNEKYFKRIGRLYGFLLCEAALELSDGTPFERVSEAMRRCAEGPPESERTEQTIWNFVAKLIQPYAKSEDPEAREMMKLIERFVNGNMAILDNLNKTL